MKIKIIFIIIISMLFLALSGCSQREAAESDPGTLPNVNPAPPPLVELIADPEILEVEVIGDDIPITRALAARMAILLLNDRHTLAGLEREITYTDVDAHQWFDRYINAAYVQGIMLGDEVNFRPLDNLTVFEAQAILNRLVPDDPIRMRITDDNRNLPISYALWVQLYESLLESFSNAGVSTGIREINMVVLADSSNNAQLPEGNIIADSGAYTGHGIDFSGFIDKEVRVFEKDGEILAVLGIVSDTPVIRGAYIVNIGSGSLTVFLGGAERTFIYTGNSTGAVGNTASFILSDGTVNELTIYSDSFRDKILLHDASRIEFAERGMMPLCDNFRVYSEERGPVIWRGPRNIIVGSDMVRFYEDNGRVIAAVIERRPSPETIRVVIMDSDFREFIHEAVDITSTEPFMVLDIKNGTSRTISPGERLTLTDPSTLSNRIFIEGDGMFAIHSMRRSQGTPEYRGSLEISPGDGGFIIVNEIRLEEYLYSVVPSEMPISFGNEALKVQAITARSYAYNQFYANNFHRFGANVCDSVMSQVYNNIRETPESMRAVRETEGLVLTFNNAVISANFFSTSAGVTANNGEVWAQRPGLSFPADTRPYLTSRRQYRNADFGDLTVEENMFAFIRNQNVQSYDSWSNFFRWNVEMTNEEISASINANLRARYNAAPRLIKTLQPDGVFRARPVDTIGSLVNLEVVQRGQAGNIMVMRITGTENTILVSTEFNVRSLLMPRQHVDGREAIGLTLGDGSVRENLGLLPSAFFVMERMTDGDGNILYVRFLGGGNGHGAGMSQTGVRGMTDMGRTFEEVLAHFYPGTVVAKRW
ncbi:MAG: SpoIID/LytB domain-containing protein [Defluviitaleaceae bacterium]|nr:SpoIID/LytB domain-containing protein [Defluviitaleaceae bacterium]